MTSGPRRLNMIAKIGILCAAAALAFTACSVLGIVASHNSSIAAARTSESQQLHTSVTDAYRLWLTDDAQSNMYVALAALNDPAQTALVETTWQQAHEAYLAASSTVADAKLSASSEHESQLLAAIGTRLTEYENYSQQVRAAVQAGDVKLAMRVATVDNLTTSESLTKNFGELIAYESDRVQQTSQSTHDASERNTRVLAIITFFGISFGVFVAVYIIRTMIRELGTVTRSTTDSTERLNNVSSTLSALVSGESDTGRTSYLNVESIAASVTEMEFAAQEIARAGSEAFVQGQAAVGIVETTNQRIHKLGVAGTQIGEVVELISGIAAKTNLLALNATIEAARAGEMGKSFSVVANEVKTLASDTADATARIAESIETMQTESQSAVEAMQEIATVVEVINGMQGSVAAAVDQQTATTKTLSADIQQMSELFSFQAKEVEVAVSSMDAASTRLNSLIAVSSR